MVTARLAVVVAVGLGVRIWGLGFGLPHGFARPDEEKIIAAALGIFQGDPNPHMFLYPSLFIYLNALGYWLLFVCERALGLVDTRAAFLAAVAVDASPLHLVGRTLAALCGTATLVVLYGAARELFSARIALTASALLAVVFLHVRDSHFGVTDVPVTLLVVAAWWTAIRCATRGPTYPRVAIAGVLGGLAASTKYNAAIVVLPATIAIARPLVATGRAALPNVAAALVVLYACTALAFVAGTPYALLDRAAFLTEVDAQRQTAAGLRHGSILDPARAVVGARGWTHHATFSLRFGLGLPLLVTSILGAVWLAADGLLTTLLVLSFPVSFYIAMGSSLLVYPRWIVPIVPFLCLTAAVAVDRLAGAIGRLIGRVAPRGPTDATTAASWVAASVAILIAAPTGARSIAFNQLVSRTDTRISAARWIEERFPQGATLYQTGMFYGFVDPRPQGRYSNATFNERHGVFEFADLREEGLPDLIVVLDSPLVVFSRAPAGLDALLRSRYAPIATFKAARADAAAAAPVYDQQDAFYVPFANLTSVARPGPDVRIFQRVP